MKGNGLPNTTTRQSMSSAGDFSEDVGALEEQTTYEFQAFSDTGSIVESGDILEFTTPEACSQCQDKK